MSKNNSILTILMCATMLGACASIMHGTSQEMTFQSSPEEVTVTVGGRILGKTPITSRLDKKADQSVVFSKDGYKPVTMALTTTLDSWFWGNLAGPHVFGSTTDVMNGSVNQYVPSQYFVTLTPDGASNMESFTLKSQREKAKEFIVSHYANLITNLSTDGGEDFSALAGLLHIEKDQQADASRKIHALSQVYSDAPTFADHVMALYLK